MLGPEGFLGDRYKIEEKTKSRDKLIVDRSQEMAEWIPIIEAIKKRGAKPIFLCFNNHYAGHAPGWVRGFMRAWQEYHGQLTLQGGPTEKGLLVSPCGCGAYY